MTDPTPEPLPPEAPAPRDLVLLIYGLDSLQHVALTEGCRLVIGSVPPADVVVKEHQLAPQHARVEVTEGKVWIEDLGSEYGTQVNYLRKRRTKVKPGQFVRLGGLAMGLHRLTPEQDQALALIDHAVLLRWLEQELIDTRQDRIPTGLMTLEMWGTPGAGLAGWFPDVRRRLPPGSFVARSSYLRLDVLLPRISEAEARKLAKRLVTKVRGLRVGLALLPGNARSLDELLEVAHEACGVAVRTRGFVHPGPARTIYPGRRWRLPFWVWTGEQPPPELREVRVELEPVAHAPAMVKLLGEVKHAARYTGPVLLLGETGVGKEVVARYLHRHGRNPHQPFQAVNCAQLVGDLGRSALFGHEKGAFTCASTTRPR